MGFAPVSISLGGLNGKDGLPRYQGSRFNILGVVELAEARLGNAQLSWPYKNNYIFGGRYLGSWQYPATVDGWSGFYPAWLKSFEGDAKVLCGHPWQEGVGHGNGIHKTLSAKNVVEAMAKKLRDDKDPLCPDADTEVVAVVFNSETLVDLAGLLDAFYAAFPLPCLAMVKRLARRMASYDVDSVSRPNPVDNPPWSNLTSDKMAAIKEARAVSGARMAIIDGSLAECPERDELQDLIARKRAFVESVENANELLISAAAEGAGQFLYSQAQSPKLCADALLNANDFKHSDIYSAGVLFAGSPGELSAIKEAFGL